MSQATPRKFSEKIAILERKQNEEQEQFSTVMRDVRAITSTSRTPPAANSPYTAPSSVGSDHYHQQQPQSNQQSPNYAHQQDSSHDLCSKLSPEGPHPMLSGYQGRQGGSLPNVHQVVQNQQQPHVLLTNNNATTSPGPYLGWSPNWPMAPTGASSASPQQPQQHVRTRSPGAQHHFHPYCRNGLIGLRHDRMSQGDAGVMAGAHLQPPDPSWPKARSDPAIHTMMTVMDGNIPAPSVSSGVLPITASPIYSAQQPQQLLSGSTATSAPTSAHILPSHSPIAFFPSYPLGPAMVPQHQQQQQPQMYITPAPQHIGQPSSSTASAGMTFVPDLAIGSLPNMNFPMNMMMHQQMPHQQQRHSTAGTGTTTIGQYQPQHSQLSNGFPMMAGNGNNATTATMMMLNSYHMGQQQQRGTTTTPYANQQHMNNCGNGLKSSAGSKMPMTGDQCQLGQQNHQLATPSNAFAQSQSAPTSPAQTMREHPLRQQWTPTRHFSASPDGLEVPNICVTGTDGGDIDCFQDLQDLHLDSEMVQMLKEPGNEQVDPVCETQLLN